MQKKNTSRKNFNRIFRKFVNSSKKTPKNFSFIICSHWNIKQKSLFVDTPFKNSTISDAPFLTEIEKGNGLAMVSVIFSRSQLAIARYNTLFIRHHRHQHITIPSLLIRWGTLEQGKTLKEDIKFKVIKNRKQQIL